MASVDDFEVQRFFAMTAEKIPESVDWGPTPRRFDVEFAFDKFGGKSIDEIYPYVREFPLSAIECLNAMPQIPFSYYVLAFERFVMDYSSSKDLPAAAADGASAFLILVRDKLRTNPKLIMPVMDRLMPLVLFLSRHQSNFGADPKIYGAFSMLADEIEQLYEQKQSSEDS